MKKLTIASFFLTLIVSCLLLVVPTYERQTRSAQGGVSVTHASLLQVNGQRVLIALMVPVLITLMPLLAPNRGVRIVAAVALCFFVFISGYSIGLFYLPSAGMIIAASILSPQPRSV